MSRYWVIGLRVPTPGVWGTNPPPGGFAPEKCPGTPVHHWDKSLKLLNTVKQKLRINLKGSFTNYVLNMDKLTIIFEQHFDKCFITNVHCCHSINHSIK